jgi:hypothetical protein
VRRRSGLGKIVNNPSDHFSAANINQSYQGCSVGFAAQGCTRPAGRTRPGQFEEDQLVVGMRFIVI